MEAHRVLLGFQSLVLGGLVVLGIAMASPAVASREGTSRSEAQIGKASWYGHEFRGRRTASGARFEPNAMTAAHRTLPLGTVVRVTNLRNGRSVTVRINDRGPFIRHRDLDLSLGAARAIGMLNRGVAPVLIEPL